MSPWSWHAGFEPALLARDSNSRNASRLPDVTKSPLESRSSPRPRPRPRPEPRPARLGAAYPAACPAPRPRSGLPPPGLAIGRAGTPGPAPRVSAPPPQRGARARGPGRRVRLRGGAEAAAGPECRGSEGAAGVPARGLGRLRNDCGPSWGSELAEEGGWGWGPGLQLAAEIGIGDGAALGGRC
ncbi:hypothetical protein H8959_018156 [Pygathrix nigripes]